MEHAFGALGAAVLAGGLVLAFSPHPLPGLLLVIPGAFFFALMRSAP